MAKRFTFRLDTLLRVRELRQREAQRRVSAVRAQIARLDLLDTQTAGEIARTESTMLEEQGRPQVDAAALSRGRAWIAYLRATVAQRRVVREPLLADLARFQDELREARINTKMLEKLRERRWLQHRKETDRREQSAAEELAQQLHGGQESGATFDMHLGDAW